MSDDYVNRELLAERDAAVQLFDKALARIEALTAALEKADALAATLQWYGDQCAIMKKPTIDAQWATNRLRDDNGTKARESAHAYREARKATT